ncbi:MAG: hypothetical protein WAV56_01355 [Microgenomates group bacterium]
MSTLMNLHPGKVVVIKEGFGLVPIAVETEDTIAFATKTYAITATGILLTKSDFPGIYTYLEVKPAGFHISAKARRLQEALLLPLETPYTEIPYLKPYER